MVKIENNAFSERLNGLYELAHSRDHETNKTKFAESCGISKKQLDSYLSGKSEPVVSLLRKIAERQHVSASWLVGETDMPNIQICEMLKSQSPLVINDLQNMLEFLSFKYKK